MENPQFLCACFYLVSIFKFCLGVDTLFPGQTLADGEVLVSSGRMFELGFFSPGKSTGRFLGIWFKATPDVVVWVANRENSIMNSQGVLSLAKNGTLVLSTTESGNIWSSNTSRAVSSPVLKLLDIGNLVVVEELTVGSPSQESYIWQSFDYPTDTRLPGMKMVQDPDTGEDKHLTSWKNADDPSFGDFSYRIVNQGLSQIMIMNGTRKRFRDNFWNGYFSGFPNLADQTWKTEVESKGGRLISVFEPFNDSITTRLTLNHSGPLQRYLMNEEKDGWILMITLPHDLCGNYCLCGQNGICKTNTIPVCECLRGFQPKSEKEWRLFEWKSGCHRSPPLDCQKEDGFLKVEGIKFPDSVNFRLNTSMSIRECGDECLKC